MTTAMDAHQVFDVMSTQHEVTMSSVIHVSVSHRVYPVTEVVVHEVFETYGYGVIRLVVFQGDGWAEASVQLRSGNEAVRARDALNGQNIYDGCCKMYIKCTPTTPSPSHDSNLPDIGAARSAHCGGLHGSSSGNTIYNSW